MSKLLALEPVFNQVRHDVALGMSHDGPNIGAAHSSCVDEQDLRTTTPWATTRKMSWPSASTLEARGLI